MSTPDLDVIADPAIADLAFEQGVCWWSYGPGHPQWMNPANSAWGMPSEYRGSNTYSAPADWIGHRLHRVWSTIGAPKGAVLAQFGDVGVDDKWAFLEVPHYPYSQTSCWSMASTDVVWLWPATTPPPPEITPEVAAYLLTLSDDERVEVLNAATGGAS